MSTTKRYEVGYCRPPKNTQWKKGQCGNPTGKRKRPYKTVMEIIDSCFERQISIVENAKPRRCGVFEAVLLQLSRKAAAGNKRALDVLVRYREFARRYSNTPAFEIFVVDERPDKSDAFTR